MTRLCQSIVIMTSLTIPITTASRIPNEQQKVADTSALQDFVASIPRNERIVLRIDKSTQFAHFINVVDIFKKYRHENFSIVTEKVNASEGS